MALTLYAHPLSSYCWKALTALYENGTPFTYRSLEDPEAGKELAALWPLMRFPVLVDAGETVVEASLVIEHLDLVWMSQAGGPGPASASDPTSSGARTSRSCWKKSERQTPL